MIPFHVKLQENHYWATYENFFERYSVLSLDLGGNVRQRDSIVLPRRYSYLECGDARLLPRVSSMHPVQFTQRVESL